MRSPNQRPDEPSIAALVLAGGRSTRMGQDKALLKWQNVTLLERSCQVAQTLTPQVHVLSPWPERYHALLPDGVESLRESQAGRGPLWALQQGLTQTSAEWLLLLACDMPLVRGVCLRQWRSHLHHLPDTCLAYVSQSQTGTRPRWEPFCGFYRQASLGSLTQFLTHQGQSFQHWLTQINACPIPLDPEDIKMFFNCNTPDDWSGIENLKPPSPFQ